MEAIRMAFERCARALTRRPVGRGVSRTRLRQGLICQIEEGPWKLVAELPVQIGASSAGPSPGVFGRAALGSCLAAGYMMHAAKLQVPISAVEVEVEAADDDSALLGAGGAAPGYLEVRYVVTVETSAPESDVQRVLDEGDAHSPYLDVLARAQKVRRSVRIVQPRDR